MSKISSSESNIVLDSLRCRISEMASQLKDDVHVWEARLPLEKYLLIKELIEDIPDLEYALDVIPAEMSKIVRYAVAEWWKREYHDRGKMELGGMTTAVFEKAVKLSGIEHDKVNPEKDNSPTKWRDTLAAEGGIPVYDVISKLKGDRGNNMTRCLEFLYEADGDLDDSLAEMLFRNNQTIKRSSSIRDLVPYLQKGNMPYDPNEKINNVSSLSFSDFTEALETARQIHLQNKFSLEYHLWMLDGFEPSIKTCIRFKPDEVGEGRNFAIGRKKLEYWGVGNVDTIRRVALDFHTADTHVLVPFFRCNNGDWIPFRTENKLETDLPLFRDVNFDIIVEDQIISQQRIRRNLRDKGFVQLYSQDGANWTSFGTSGKHSLVIFDPSDWSSEESLPLGGSEYEYLPLVDGKCALFSNKDGRKRVDFNNAEGNLFVEPVNVLFDDNGFFGKTGRKFFCTKPGEDDDIPVYVTDSFAFRGKIVKSDRIATESSWVDVPKDELQVELWEDRPDGPSRGNYDFDRNSIAGYHVLRFKAKGKEAKLHVFFLPNGAEIKRKITPNSKIGTFEVAGFEQMKVEFPKGVHMNANGRIQCNYQSTGVSDGTMMDITDADSCVLHVGLYWPYDTKDILKITSERRCLHTQNAVSTVFAGTYVHRCFSTEGVALNRISEDSLYEFNDFIRRGMLNGATQAVIDGCSFHLFDRELGQDDMHSYIVESGNEISIDRSNLKFVFVPSNEGELVPLDMTISENTGYRGARNHLFIKIPGEIGGVDGVIFQSLEDVSFPDVYFKPKYKPKSDDSRKIRPEEKISRQQKRIGGYFTKISDNKDYSVALRAFEIAERLRCHFGWFDEIKALCQFDDKLEERLVRFFEFYVSSCEQSGNPVNYAGLWRLVGEFVFDWVLIPARYWKDLVERKTNVYCKYIESLFKSRPGAKGATKYKLSLLADSIVSSDDMKFKRTGSMVGTIAKLIRGKNKDLFKLVQGKDKKLSILKSINDANILDEIITLINR